MTKPKRAAERQGPVVESNFARVIAVGEQV